MAKNPTVADFMDRKFAKLTPDTSISKALDLLLKKKLIGIMVVDDQGQVAGILSEKDCLKVVLHDTFHRLPDSKVKHYMHQVVQTVSSTLPAVEAAKLFMKSRFRRMPVVDDNKLVGQLTRRDLLRGLHEFCRK